MARSGARAYRQADRSADHLCSDAASGTCYIPGAFGGGDIKLMAVSGAFLGTGPVVCAMFFGLLTGGAYGAFMLKSKKLGKKDVFAFGPFLAFRTGACGIIWKSDRYMVSAFFIKRVTNSY